MARRGCGLDLILGKSYKVGATFPSSSGGSGAQQAWLKQRAACRDRRTATRRRARGGSDRADVLCFLAFLARADPCDQGRASPPAEQPAPVPRRNFRVRLAAPRALGPACDQAASQVVALLDRYRDALQLDHFGDLEQLVAVEQVQAETRDPKGEGGTDIGAALQADHRQ
jgi:hypothetical protein